MEITILALHRGSAFKRLITLSKSVGFSLSHFLSLANQGEDEMIVVTTFHCLIHRGLNKNLLEEVIYKLSSKN